MTTLKTDLPPKAHLHLLALPAELLTQIFDLAYRRPASITIVSRERWRREHNSHRLASRDARPTTDPAFRRPFPGSKVSFLLVSKAYFVYAARAYVQSRPFDVGRESWSSDSKWGILTAFARDVVGPCSFIDQWSLRSLRSAKVVVDLSMFEAEGEDEVQLDVLGRELRAEDFEGCAVDEVFRGCAGMARFELIPGELLAREAGPQGRAMWKTNVKTLEGFLRTKVTRRCDRDVEDGGSTEGAETPLYPGSKVFLHNQQDLVDGDKGRTVGRAKPVGAGEWRCENEMGKFESRYRAIKDTLQAIKEGTTTYQREICGLTVEKCSLEEDLADATKLLTRYRKELQSLKEKMRVADEQKKGDMSPADVVVLGVVLSLLWSMLSEYISRPC